MTPLRSLSGVYAVELGNKDRPNASKKLTPRSSDARLVLICWQTSSRIYRPFQRSGVRWTSLSTYLHFSWPAAWYSVPPIDPTRLSHRHAGQITENTR